MNRLIYVLILSLTGLAQIAVAQNEARELIKEVVTNAGGIEAFKNLKDVTYEYTFKSKEKGIKDVSIERYIFDGELSFAKYTSREYFALPDMKGTLVQYYNGQETWSKINNEQITEQQPAYVGHFFRKTNYYWFAMMYKLLDPGIKFKMYPDRKVEETTYKIVEMTFEDGVGETSDKYLLYINPETKLIDQFLFTVLGFGFSDPFLMQLEYEELDGLMFTTYRKYAPANWEGKVIKEEWNEQISKNIKFNNGFTEATITQIK